MKFTHKTFKIFFSIILISVLLPNFCFADASVIYQRKETDILGNATKRANAQIFENKNKWDTVTFGHYEQDDNKDNGKEAIEWYVLDNDKSSRRLTLLTKYIIECLAYHFTMNHATWEECSLRDYLNHSLIKDLFTDEEIECINDSVLENKENPYYNIPSGNATIDKVYIPSIDDINNFFGDKNLSGMDRLNDLLKVNLSRAAKTTEHARKRGVRYIENVESPFYQNGNYFLRTIGRPGYRKWYNDMYADAYESFVSELGEVMPSGTGINSADDGVRLMIQVNY